ncbi:hypothetical protein GP486_000329 [Trichoglossum hirsutum]|uniref:Nephrocystin 3-like N-terminal domain-containing protein n=1 Tax=Trichoglossum hirsutum TaxID=265104 RepID=A0A9P8LJ43_9PEZI|nr:hypothetical protein GP486_000329 [Trichoglossum hirsutum]
MSSGSVDPESALVASATKGICFFGTPHGASSRASWTMSIFQVKKALDSHGAQQSKPGIESSEDESIIRINAEFADIARQRGIQILSFYEKAPTHTIIGRTLVVDKRAATVGIPGELFVSISSDHNDLAKFNTRSESGYKATLTFIRGILQITLDQIAVSLPQDARDSISAVSQADQSDATSVSSDLANLGLGSIERERSFLDHLRVNWLEDLELVNIQHGTCSWILESEEWKQWVKGDQILWVTGENGTGKTYLAKFLVDKLREINCQELRAGSQDQEQHPDSPEVPARAMSPDSRQVLACFCDARRPYPKRADAVVRSLLYQILAQDHSLFKYINTNPIFPSAQGTWLECRQALEIVLGCLGRGADIVIDAIDECEESSRLLIDFLSTLEAVPSVRVIVTSCPSPEFLPSLRINLGKSNSDSMRDLKGFLKTNIANLTIQRGFTPEFGKELLRMVHPRLTTFLGARLALEYLETKPTVRDTRRALQRMPDYFAINELFSDVLENLHDDNRNTIIRALYFVEFAKESPSLEILSAFLATTNAGAEMYLPTHVDIRENAILDLEGILRNFRPSLFEVSPAATVALVHPSLRKFLRSPKSIFWFLDTISQEDGGRRFHNATTASEQVHSVMAEACLKYMNAAFRGRDDFLHFTTYCLNFWSEHVRLANKECTEDVVNLVGEFLDSSAESRALYQYWAEELQKSEQPIYRILPSNNDPAFVLSALDLCEVFAGRLNVPMSSFEQTDSNDYLPLHFAAANDAITSTVWIIDQFKKCDAEKTRNLIMKTSKDSLSAIGLAVRQGNLYIVDFLLDTIGGGLSLVPQLMKLAADYHQREIFAALWKRTRASSARISLTTKESIFTDAVRVMNQDIARVLLNDQVTVDVDSFNQAIENQSADFVKFLIDQGADVEAKNTTGSYPLHVAARLGIDEVVTTLLHSGASVNKIDNHGRTPLHVASQKGFVKTSKLLLENGSSLNSVDDKGRLAAHYAAEIGHDKLLRLLINAGSDILTPDDEGQTVLHLAAWKGHDAVVALLLDLENTCVSVDAKNSDMRAPLHYAVMSGIVNIVSRLLSAGAYVDITDSGGQTPLHIAASISSEIMVAELLRYGADVAVCDNQGMTPLHHACKSRYPSVAVLETLLNYGSEVNEIDAKNKTPLNYAVEKRNFPCIMLLLACDATADLADGKGVLSKDLIEGDKPDARELLQKLEGSI